MVTFPTPHIHRWSLPNGLGTLVQEDHSAPVASVQAWCEAGSILEGEHSGAGISHLLEHLLFKGTEKRGPNEIAQAVQDLGGYINAYTSFDRTVYWIDTPAKGAATAIDILADAMMNSTLPPEEFAKEQEVIRREFAMGADDPDRVASKLLFATAFREHPYRYPVIGHLDLFNRLTRDDVWAYYKARYVPNNLFFVITGAVDARQVYEQLAAFFAPYPRQPLPPVYIPREPAQWGRREVLHPFPTELTRLEMAWRVPELTHPDTPALDLLAILLGGGRSSRLYRALREKAGLVHSIGAWCYTPAQSGLFGVEALLDPPRRAEVEAAIAHELRELRETGVGGSELAKAKKQALAGQLGALTTTRGMAADLGGNWLLARNPHFTRDYLAALQLVTPADVARVLETYFEDRNLTLIALHPAGAETAAEAESAAVAEPPIHRFTLANGLRLLVREDPRLPLVSGVACFKAGLLAESEEANGITRLMARTLLKGTTTRSAEQIAEEIETLGGALGADAGNNSFNIAFRTMAPDVATGIALMADVLLHPTFPEAAVAREKEVQLASLKAEEEEPTSVARNLVRSALYAGHPYGLRSGGTPESVSGVTREALAAFHQRTTTGRNGVIAIFGDVCAQTVRAQVEAAFAELPAGEPLFEPAPQPPVLEQSVEVEATLDKTQAILMVGFRGASIYEPERLALEIIDEACSDLGSRFFIRIREKLGLAYFVGSSMVPGLAPGSFTFYLGTDPAKLEAVKAELLDEIRLLAEGGLSEEEFRRAKEKLLGQQALRNQSNGAFAHTCALDELYGLGFDEYRRLPEQMAALTREEVAAVARRYFHETPQVLAVVRPG